MYDYFNRGCLAARCDLCDLELRARGVPRGVGPMESVVPTEFDDSTPAPQTMSDVASAGHEQLGVLAREVMSRSAPDAAAWIARSIGLDPI